MGPKNSRAAFDNAGFEAMMEHYRAEMLRYQRATPPGGSLADNRKAAQPPRRTDPAAGCTDCNVAPVPRPSPMPGPERPPWSDEQPAQPEPPDMSDDGPRPAARAPHGSEPGSIFNSVPAPIPTPLPQSRQESEPPPRPEAPQRPEAEPPLMSTPQRPSTPAPEPMPRPEASQRPEAERPPMSAPPRPQPEPPLMSTPQRPSTPAPEPMPRPEAPPRPEAERPPMSAPPRPQPEPPLMSTPQRPSMPAPEPMPRPEAPQRPAPSSRWETGPMAEEPPARILLTPPPAVPVLAPVKRAAAISGEGLSLLGELSALSCRRTPERLIFAKGCGAFGSFHPYEAMGELSAACFLQNPAGPTPVFVRFSADVGRCGADAARCRHGMAARFFTEEGPCDLFASQLPVMPLRDARLIAGFVSAVRPARDTGLRDNARLWRLVCEHPQALGSMLWLYTDLGTLGSYRSVDYHAAPAVWTAKDKSRRAVRCRWLTRQGVHTLGRFEAEELAGSDPDAVARDLHLALAAGERPQFELAVQVIEPRQIEELDFDPFDPTILWDEARFEPRRIGLLTLERNPSDHAEQVEGFAFSPANCVEGIEMPDSEWYTAAAFAVSDAQRCRTGTAGPLPRAGKRGCPWRREWPASDDMQNARAQLDSMGERQRRTLARNLAGDFSALEPETLERVLTLLTELDLAFGKAVTADMGFQL